ncbi:hypothetical protein E4T49_06902 [Aureobasidium sp. EXF-10728]|nr:hypothetical protein E4T49_06902 [Aureobasidium sp. EXF-10728]
MDNSPLSRLPFELHEQIFDYTMATDIQQIDHCQTRYSSSELVKPLMIRLTRRYSYMATCRELQNLGLRLHLRRTEFVWNCSSVPSSWHITKAINSWDYNVDVIFDGFPDLQTQGLIDSVRGVGALTSDNDYLHREAPSKGIVSQKHASWINEPLEILILYQRATYIAFCLRTEQHRRGLGHYQLFYRHSYNLQTFTDGNAARPIKKALRGTWKRDTLELTIDMLSEVGSLRKMETAMALLDIEHHERVEAIQREIERQKRLSRENDDVVSSDEQSIFAQFVQSMEAKYSLWRQRVMKFHEGLIKVVMLGYRIDYRTLAGPLTEVRHDFERMAPDEYTGDKIVDAVVEVVRATKSQEMEPRYRMESDLWLDARDP